MAEVKPDTPTSAKRRGRPDEGARDALIDAATELFMQRDFDQVSTDEILARAGVSRGAMYHHFSSKLELFRVVWEASERRVIARIASAAASASGPFEGLRLGCLAYMNEAETSLELQRIGLRQSRAVLGWEQWRSAASTLGLEIMEAGVAAAMESGEIEARDVATTAHMLLGALIEAAMLISTADNPRTARKEVEPVVLDLLDGLRVTS